MKENLSPIVLVTRLRPEDLEALTSRQDVQHSPFSSEKSEKRKTGNELDRSTVKRRRLGSNASNSSLSDGVVEESVNVKRQSQKNMCGEINNINDIEIIYEKIKTQPNIEVDAHKFEDVRDYEQLKAEQNLKPCSEIVSDSKYVNEESKDVIFKAFKNELTEFENYLGVDIKLETFSDFKYEPKEKKEAEDDDIDSEVEVIQEIRDDWIKIERSDQVISKKNYTYKRSEKINALINEHTCQTIPLPRTSQTVHRPFSKGINFYNKKKNNRKNKGNNSFLVEKANSTPTIKVKAPQALGINEEITTKSNTNEDCRTKLLRYEQVGNSSESTVEQICLLFVQYFNSLLELPLNNLIELFKKILKELIDSCEAISGISVTVDNNVLDHESQTLVLQKYSKTFYGLFSSIVNLFEETHKKQMIPVVYLFLLRETVTCIRLEDVRSIILKLLMLENYDCKNDLIFNKTHVESKKLLNIYERWVAKCYDKLNSACKGSDTVLEDTQSIERENVQSIRTLEKRNIEVVESFNTTPLIVNHCSIDDKKQASTKSSNYPSVLQGSLESEEEPTAENCEYQENLDLFQDCPNEECDSKLTVQCCFCFEYCSCPNFCQVECDQKAGSGYVSCREHKSFISFWGEAQTTDWHRIGRDHEMPYEPVCWRTQCGKKAFLMCVCKTRAYCCLICRDEDWNSSHHKFCSRHTDPSLYYTNTC